MVEIKREKIYKIFKVVQVLLMLIPFLLDFFAEKNGQGAVAGLNGFLGGILTTNVLISISWITYILLIYYVFKAFKNLSIEGLKMVTLVAYNILRLVDIRAMKHTYYLWIISILGIYIVEVFAHKYTPENKSVIDISEKE